MRLVEGVDYKIDNNPGHYKLLRDYNNGEFVVKKGFRFEPSIPEWLQFMFPIDDPRLIVASLEHDYMNIHRDEYSNAVASRRFYKNVRTDGMGVIRASIMTTFLFLAVALD